MMKSKILLVGLTFFMLSFVFSCATKEVGEDVPVVLLKGTVLQSDSLLLGNKVVAIVDDCLVIPTWKSEYLYDVFQMKGDSLILKDRLILRGQGPYDLTVSEEMYDESSKQFVVYDCNIGRGFLLSGKSFNEMMDYTHWKSLGAFQNETFIPKMVIETDSTIITTFMKDGFKSFVGRYNLNTGRHSVLFGLWPDDGFDGSDFVKQTVYANGSLLKCPDKNLFLVSSQLGQYAEIFKIEDERITPISKILDLYPQYEVADDGLNVRYARDNRRGLDISVTSNFIYVMPNTGTIEEYVNNIGDSDSYNYTDEILVYDWNGVLRTKFKLDYDVLTLFVDKDERFIYGKMVDKKVFEEYLVRFELDEGGSEGIG